MFCVHCKHEYQSDMLACPVCGRTMQQSRVNNGSVTGQIYVVEEVPQLTFENTPLPYWQQETVQQETGSIEQLSFPSTDQMQSVIVQKPETSLVVREEKSDTIMIHYVPEQVIQQVLPITDEMLPVYIPPMYTPPKVAIPRYRAISGFLSVFIVAVLLCVGSAHLVQRNGLVEKARTFWSGPEVKTMQPTAKVVLPEPPKESKKDQGEAYSIIPSATSAFYFDEETNQPRFPQRVFKVGDVVTILYGIREAKSDGVVSIKWYTDNHVFVTQVSDIVKAADLKTKNYYGRFQIKYYKAAQGKVELYWNNVFAQRLYFVVR